MSFLFYSRADIKNGAIQFYQNIDCTRIGRGIDYLGRGIGHTICLIKHGVIGMYIMNSDTYFKQVLAIGGLALSLSLFIANTVVKIFIYMGIQNKLKSEIALNSIVLIGCTGLTAAAAVGLGLAPSLSVFFRKTLPIVLIGALACTLMAIIKIGINTILNDVGNQDGPVREAIEWSVTMISTVYLTSIMAVGLGLAQTSADGLSTILRIAVFT